MRWIILVMVAGLLGDVQGAVGADGERSVKFAGRTWQVKTGKQVGPGPNDFSDATDSVRVDPAGHLHLAILPAGGSWTCSEVVAPASLGFGEYRWTIAGKFSTLDPRSVVGLFTYEDNDHEIDFEVSRWGKPGDDNAQFVLQPYAPDSMRRFDAGAADRLTISLIWAEKSVRFRCWVGADTSKSPLHEWTYTGPKIPRPGKERLRMNFWLLDGRPAPNATRQDVTIETFEFRPIAQP